VVTRCATSVFGGVREIVTRGARIASKLAQDAAEGVPRAATLAALHRIDINTYHSIPVETRVRTLISAFSTARRFNAWGIPHAGWGELANLLIDEREGAKAGLRQFLRDQRPAPTWGSSGATDAASYEYRVCDYAWAMLLATEGAPLTIPRKPAERDALIAPMLSTQDENETTRIVDPVCVWAFRVQRERKSDARSRVAAV